MLLLPFIAESNIVLHLFLRINHWYHVFFLKRTYGAFKEHNKTEIEKYQDQRERENIKVRV